MFDKSASGSAAIVEDHGHPRRWTVLAIVGVAGFMSALDSTIANLALPSIQAALKATPTDLQWVLDAYILMFGGLLLLGGRMGDLLGRRRVFLTGLAVFAGASLACGLGGEPGALIVSRLVQGAGAALLIPGAQSIVVTVFRHPRERRVALAIWGGLTALGSTLGVVGGGVLVNYLGWRWVFLINPPIAAAVAVAALLVVPALRPATIDSRRSFDALGAATLTGALLLLVYGLIAAGERGWSSALTLGSFGLAAALSVLFAVVEWRNADPLVPLRLLTRGPLLASASGLMCTWFIQIPIFFMISVYQQQVLGASPLQAGLGLLGIGLPAMVVAAALPRVTGRVHPARFYPFGAALFLLGALLLTRVDAHSSYAADLLPGLALIGLAIPLCLVSLMTMGIADVPPADSGVASGLLRTISQAGAALGVATVITLALARAKELTDTHHAVADALAAGFRWGFAMTAGIAAASLLLSLGFLARGLHRTAPSPCPPAP